MAVLALFEFSPVHHELCTVIVGVIADPVCLVVQHHSLVDSSLVSLFLCEMVHSFSARPALLVDFSNVLALSCFSRLVLNDVAHEDSNLALFDLTSLALLCKPRLQVLFDVLAVHHRVITRHHEGFSFFVHVGSF